MSRCTSIEVQRIFECWQQRNPAPTTELTYHSTFELLVAVVLSAQATDVSVNKATSILFSVANTPESLLQLGETQLQHYIKSIGLYKTKAANLIKLCQLLLMHHHGIVPNSREALEALPGVGRKTANVILNTAFGESVIAVDTHIFRISNRIGLAAGNDVLTVEKQLMQVIPKPFQRHAHHWLILHGRYVCTARAPKCAACNIRDWCHYPKKNL